jgi:hypothetical protein
LRLVRASVGSRGESALAYGLGLGLAVTAASLWGLGGVAAQVLFERHAIDPSQVSVMGDAVVAHRPLDRTRLRRFFGMRKDLGDSSMEHTIQDDPLDLPLGEFIERHDLLPNIPLEPLTKARFGDETGALPPRYLTLG